MYTSYTILQSIHEVNTCVCAVRVVAHGIVLLKRGSTSGGPEVQQDGPGQHPGDFTRQSRQHEHVLRAFFFSGDLDGHQDVSARVSPDTSI